MKTKATALVLVLCMVLAMLPAGVSAAQPRQGVMIPAAVGTLEPAAAAPNATEYKIKLTSSGHGTAQLMGKSSAAAGTAVYFEANPDDGYLAEIYYDGLDADDLVYVGADIIGFVMPAKNVTLEVKFVAAQGSSHSIDVYEEGGTGEYALSRYKAKANESVLLAVKPAKNAEFEPEGYVWVSGAPAFYLFEDGETGIHYYEIIMGSENVNVFLSYKRVGPFYVTPWLDGDNGGTITVSPEKAYVNDLVTVTITPKTGYKLIHARAVSYAGDLITELTPIGNNKYTFRMHPRGVELHVLFEAQEKNVTVKAGSGGRAYTDVTRARVGSTVTLTCTPNDNYRVDKITGVDGLKEKSANVYTFPMPARDVSISVTFKTIYNPVKVTVATGLGGTASANVTTAKSGDTVKLTAVPQEGYRVARITGVKDLKDTGGNTYTFTMPDQAVELSVLFLRHENPFLDVNETQFFYAPVLWAAEKNITSGVDDELFAPFNVCNRAQVVTFLWRYAGSPEPVSGTNPFADVPAGSFYTKPVLWAVEHGITMGVDDTHFGPDLPCNRAQVVTFLWRLLGKPQPGVSEHGFGDVDAGSFYEEPVLWAVEHGITTGADAAHFDPNGQCQRAQVVTFLHRTAQLPAPEPEEPGQDTLIPPSAEEGTEYVLDLSAKTFHIPSCGNVEQISEEHFHAYLGTRDVLLEYGYSPCGHCDP